MHSAKRLGCAEWAVEQCSPFIYTACTIWLFIDLHLFNMDLKWNHNCPSRIINFVYNTLARMQLYSTHPLALSWIQRTRMYQKLYYNCTAAITAPAQEDEFSFLHGNQQLRSVEQHPAVSIRTDEDMNMRRSPVCTSAQSMPLGSNLLQVGKPVFLPRCDFIGYLRDSLISVHVHLDLSHLTAKHT